MKSVLSFMRIGVAAFFLLWLGIGMTMAQCEVAVTAEQPYSESFNDDAFDCWTSEEIHGGHWSVLNMGSSSVAAFECPADSTGGEARLISPILDLSGAVAPVLNFQFSMLGVYQADELRVCYRISPVDTWHVLESYSFSDWENAYEGVFELPDPSSTYQISFLARALGGMYIMIDEVTVSSSEGCLKPSHLSVSNIHTADALISWDSYGNETSWTLEVDGNERVITENPYLLTGLFPRTLYTIRLKANCGDDQSEWTNEVSFTSACEAIVITAQEPFFDDFEASLEFECWTDELISGTLGWSVDENYFNYNHSAFFIWLGEESRLISPMFDLSQITNHAMLSFKRQQPQGQLDVDELSLFYRTALDVPWQQLAHYVLPTEGYEEVLFELPDPTATYQFSFVARSNDAEGVYVDDVRVFDGDGVGVEEAPLQASCRPNPTTGNITIESNAINADITVYDVYGKVMMNSKVASERTELDFSAFASGIYMVRIAAANGSTTVKVVKE